MKIEERLKDKGKRLKDKVEDKNNNNLEDKRDLEERTFNFSVEVINFLKTIKYSKVNDIIKYQLAKAVTSLSTLKG